MLEHASHNWKTIPTFEKCAICSAGGVPMQRVPNQLFHLRSVQPNYTEEFSMDDDIWDFLGYVEYDED